MFDLSKFDPGEIEPYKAYEPLPAGRYKARIVASEFRRTHAGNGEYLQLDFEILDGEHAGRRIVARPLLEHPSEAAVRIGKSKLSAVCHATGVMSPFKSIDALHDIPILIDVILKTRRDTGVLQSEISGFHSQESQLEDRDLPPSPFEAA